MSPAMVETLTPASTESSGNPKNSHPFLYCDQILTDLMDNSPNLGQNSWKPSVSKPRMVKARKSGSMKHRPPSSAAPSTDRVEKIEEKLSGWNPFAPPEDGGSGANLNRSSSWRSTDSGGRVSFSFGSEGSGFVFGSGGGGGGAKKGRDLSRNSSIESEEMDKLSSGKGGDFGEGVFVFGSSVEESTEKKERLNVREMSGNRGDNESGDFRLGVEDVFAFGSSIKESSARMERLNIGSRDSASDASAAVGGFVFGSNMKDSSENTRDVSAGNRDSAGGASAVAGGFAFGSNMNDSLEKMERLNIGETSAGSRESAGAGTFAFGSSSKTSSVTSQPSAPHSEFKESKESKEGFVVDSGFVFGKTAANTLLDDLEKLKIGSQTEKSAGAMRFKFTFQVGKQDGSSNTGSSPPSQATDTPSFHPPNADHKGNRGGWGAPHVELRTPDQEKASRLTRETSWKEEVDVVNDFASGTNEDVTSSFGGSAVNAVGDDMSKLRIGSKVENFVGSTSLKFSFQAGEQGQSSSMGTVPPFQGTAPPPFCPPPARFQQVGAQFSFASQHGGLETQHMEFKTSKHDSSRLTTENLFSSQAQNIEFSVKRGEGRSTKSKKKKGKSRQPASYHHSFANQFVSTEGGFQEKSETERTDDYSPMDCSPYPEETVADQYSREASVASADTQRSISVEREETLVYAAEKMNINEGNDMSFGEFDDNGSKDHAQRYSASASSFEDKQTCGYGKESDIPRYENMRFYSETRTAPMTAETGSLGSNFEGQASAGETGFFFSSNVQDFDQSKLSFTSSPFVQEPLSAQKRYHRRKSKTIPGQDSFLCTPNSGVTFASPTSNTFPPTSTSMPLSSGVEQKDISFVSQSKDGNEEEKSKEPEASQDSKTMTASSVAALEACEKWRYRGNQAYSKGNLFKAEDYYTRGIDSLSLKETGSSCIRSLTLCYSNRAATRMSLGRTREAIGDCMVALSIDPNFLRAQVRAANCYLSLGEIGEALNAFKKCLQAKDINTNLKLVTEASDGLQKAQQVADLTGQCAELLLKRTSNDATKALHIVSEALVISPLSESLMEMKAEALLMMRKYEEVIKFCEETLDLAEKNSAVPEADSQLNDVVRSELRKSSFARIWRWHLISKSYFYLGKLEEALELLQKHEKLKPAGDKYGNRSSDSSTSLALTIDELLRLKAAGNEAFQAARHSEAVECYTAALMCNAESRPFAAVCFCNRAAAYQALGQIADAIADCSLAIALDASYPKAISRRATLHKMIRDYGQAANDLHRLISLLEKRSEERDNQSGASGRSIGNTSDLKKARMRLATVEEEARKGRSLDMYMILGVEPSSSAAHVKKAYRKAALRHHPDKAGQFLVRNENVDDELWREVANEVHTDADRLFKMIGESYTILSDLTKRQQYDAEEEMRNNLSKGYNGPSTPKTPADSYSSRYERNTSRRQWRSDGSFYQR